MSDTTLRDLVLKRLDADTQPEDEWSALVLAALEGPDELEKLLEGPSVGVTPSPSACHPEAPKAPRDPPCKPLGKPPAGPPAKPRIAFLKAIAVEGFRGIGPKATLDLTPGPGLTLVVGRNGSGKSSFAEALELLLTGETYRWENRSKVWKDGWRNLHHPKAAIAAEFALEGEKGTCTVAREWQDGPDLDAATTWAQVHGKPRTGQEALGWDTPLAAYRPFLSYNELGSMLDEGPSKLYDALSKVLGLDALVDAQATLQQARTTRDKAQKDADQDRKTLLAKLEGTTDERAAKVREALGKKDWGLDALEAVLAGSPTTRRAGQRDLSPPAPVRPPAPRPRAGEGGHESPEGRREAPASRRPDRGGEVRAARHPPRPRPPLPQSPRRRPLPRLREGEGARQRLAPEEGPGSRRPETGRERSHRSEKGPRRRSGHGCRS